MRVLRKFLGIVAVLALLIVVAYRMYPAQTKVAQKYLTGAVRNAKTAMVLSIQSLGHNATTKTPPTPVHTKSKPSSVHIVKAVAPANKQVYVSQGPSVAPANAQCWINTPTDQSEKVTPTQWNAFVKAHPTYTRAVTSHSGQPVYVASAPNLTNPGTAAQQQNSYYVVPLNASAGSVSPVPYGTFEAELKAHLGQGWKVFREGNLYALVSPNEMIQLGGKWFTNKGP